MLMVTNIANQRRQRQRQSIEDTSSGFHLRQKIGQEIGIAEIAKQPAINLHGKHGVGGEGNKNAK
jgi:hypothetical protein